MKMIIYWIHAFFNSKRFLFGKDFQFMLGLNSNGAAICRKLTSENGKLKHDGIGVVSVIWAVVYNVVAYVLMLISCLTPNLRLRILLRIVSDGKLKTKRKWNSNYTFYIKVLFLSINETTISNDFLVHLILLKISK